MEAVLIVGALVVQQPTVILFKAVVEEDSEHVQSRMVGVSPAVANLALLDFPSGLIIWLNPLSSCKTLAAPRHCLWRVAQK